MNTQDVSQLKNGLYRLYWKDGRSSPAAVGRLHNGKPWFAPVNWVSASETQIASQRWELIERAERIEAEKPPTSGAGYLTSTQRAAYRSTGFGTSSPSDEPTAEEIRGYQVPTRYEALLQEAKAERDVPPLRCTVCDQLLYDGRREVDGRQHKNCDGPKFWNRYPHRESNYSIRDLQPYSIVSLYDMIQMHAESLLTCLDTLTIVRSAYEHTDKILTQVDMDSCLFVVNTLKGICESAQLDVSVRTIDKFLGLVESCAASDPRQFPNSEIQFSGQLLTKHLSIIADNLCIELDARKMLVLDTGMAKYYAQPELFGYYVRVHFSSLRDDIESAGNCLATSNFTACVMHLARVVERSLRIYAAFLGTDFSTHWETLASNARAKLNLRISQNSLPVLQRDFCRRVQGSLESANTAWRNDTMHPGPLYSAEKALRIYNAVKGLMQDLAEHLNEKGKFVPKRKKKKDEKTT